MSTVSVIVSGVGGSRVVPACPFCAPARRPRDVVAGRGGEEGGSEDGGVDEFFEVRPSLAFRSPISFKSVTSSKRTDSGVVSQSSGGMPGGGGSSSIASVCQKAVILSSAMITHLNGYA